MSEPLAHSAREGAHEQTYKCHVENVCRSALQYAKHATQFSNKWRDVFIAAVRAAAIYHDLGKLDPIFQRVLRTNTKAKFNHVDAGTAHLLSEGQLEAAILCYSHHRGLPCIRGEVEKNANGLTLNFRDLEQAECISNTPLYKWTDCYLSTYLAEHHSNFKQVDLIPDVVFGQSNLSRRLALSCLVDADHGDTAQHYLSEQEVIGLPLRANERLKQLDTYVQGLGNRSTDSSERENVRQELRQLVYSACRIANFSNSERLIACDSPVGTGKTTAVMAHLLKIAAERNLRRIFVVLPFTNIIDQAVEVYRKALILPDELSKEENVVAAHHHRIEFDGTDWLELRLLARRWEAPIVVTTAVQFFETLAANKTSALRKLHQLPGSAIFVDESHAAMPAPLWPQMLKWLRELCDDWGCHLVLASGSLVRFWEIPDFVKPKERPIIRELIPNELRVRSAELEFNRATIRSKREPLSLDSLADFVLSKPGPRLVIFNTVQSAAVFASHLRGVMPMERNVEHLSTALTPRDRAVVIQRIRKRLIDKSENDWVLVATSCVEAGVDFSFRTAFRESCGLVNLLQVSGRANRSFEYEVSEVWDFRHEEDGLLSLHPHFKESRDVLAKLFEQGKVSPSDCTEALQWEINSACIGTDSFVMKIFESEQSGNFPEVAKLCRLITADTTTVVVNQDLVMKLKSRVHPLPSSQEVLMNSVQIWESRMKDLDLVPINGSEELFALREEQYDNFIGYMKGMLPLLVGSRAGGFCL